MKQVKERAGLEIKLETSLHILKELEKKSHLFMFDSAINICIAAIHKSIEKINKELTELQFRIKENNTRWMFRYYRFYNLRDRLELATHVFNERKGELFKLLKIEK